LYDAGKVGLPTNGVSKFVCVSDFMYVR